MFALAGQSAFDQWREIFAFDLRHIFKTCDFIREEAVCISATDRHDAVGSRQDRAWKLFEQFALVVPRFADVTLEVCVFLQCWVAVGWEHFRVGVDVDAFAFGLLQQPSSANRLWPVTTMEWPSILFCETVTGDGMPKWRTYVHGRAGP